MAMNRTAGFCKAYIEVTDITESKAPQHLMSFALVDSPSLDVCFQARKDYKNGMLHLPTEIVAYLAAVEKSGRILQVACNVMA